MGLLDFMGTGEDDPRTQAARAMAQSLLGRGGGLQRLAGGLGQYGSVMEVLRNQELKRALAEAQIKETEAQAENRRQLTLMAEQKRAQERARQNAYRKSFVSPEQQAMGAFGGPTNAAASAVPNMTGRFDQQALIRNLIESDPETAFQMSQPKADELMSVAPGASVFNKTTRQNVYTAPDKADKPPTSVQEFQFGKQDPSFNDWLMRGKQLSGTSVNVKVDNKLGEGLAGQIGPIVSGTRTQALSGIKLVDSANRILAAADNNGLFAGPGANLLLKGAQVADVLGIAGKDTKEKIQNTRAVVRGMAEQAVAARSQLGSQAQISNSEQELLNKATSGDIGELTSGEIVMIAKLNDRLGRQLYAGHASQLGVMRAQPGLQSLVPFYQVPELSAPFVSKKTRTPEQLLQEADAILNGGK
jgi:hypothetical protein